MTKGLRDCSTCGHGWNWHFDYDEELDRYKAHACEHWSGCDCKHWTQSSEILYMEARQGCGHDDCVGKEMPPGNLWCNTHRMERDCPKDASCPECRKEDHERRQEP